MLFRKTALVAGLLGMAAAFGCSVAAEDDASSSSRVGAGGDVSQVLKSTLVLEGGCTAAKVGPKHLLVSARCISGKPEIFATGKTVSFVSAATSTAATTFAPSEETETDAGAQVADTDAGTTDTDAGDTTDTATDAGTESKGSDAGSTGKSANVRTAKIASLEVAASFAAKCTDLAACGLDKTEASDSPDVALILLADELTSVPTVPIDLDVVNDADPVLVVSSGCSRLDRQDPSKLKTIKTTAVPAKSVNHDGSPYQSSPQLVSRVKASYVVTPGAGWRSSEAALCKGDFGAPMFRAGTAAVAGVTSNVTLWSETKSIPVTVQHTRVDATSRFKIGAWLEGLGVQTVHSCSETAGGCVTRTYDGGMPELSATDDTTDDEDDAGPVNALPGDGGADDDGGAVVEPPSDPYTDKLPEESASDDDYYGDYDYGDAAVAKKKKKEAGGCSTGSGPAPVSELSLVFGVALAAAVARRRRRD